MFFSFRNSAPALAPLVFIQIVPFVQRFGANYIFAKTNRAPLTPESGSEIKNDIKAFFQHEPIYFPTKHIPEIHPPIADQIKRFHYPQRRTDDSKRQLGVHFRRTFLTW